MTGKTILCCSRINAIRMTVCAGYRLMITDQWETGFAVIEIHIFPAGWIMAPGTIISHLTGMNVHMA